MADNPILGERIRLLAPTLDDSDWADVLQRVDPADAASATADKRRLKGWRRLPALVLVATAVAVAIALIPTRLDRDRRSNDLLSSALAEISTGPILHVVLRVDTAETHSGPAGNGKPRYSVVDLKTGKERTVETTTKLWFDPARHILHQQTWVGGGLAYDAFATPGKSLNNRYRPTVGAQVGVPGVDPALAAFFGGYKLALQQGNARDVGTATIDGQKVIWLRFAPAHLHQASEEIAVDPGNYRPLYLRTLCVGCTSSPPTYRIVTLEGVSRADANFTKPSFETHAIGRYSNVEKRRVPIAEVSRLIGHAAYWPGPSIAGVPFTTVVFDNYTRHSGPKITTANVTARGLGLTLVYGGRITRYGGITNIPGRQFIGITETANYAIGPGNFNNEEAGRPLTMAGAPVPREGELALSSFARTFWTGQLRRDGLYIEIDAPTRGLVLTTARALIRTPS